MPLSDHRRYQGPAGLSAAASLTKGHRERRSIAPKERGVLTLRATGGHPGAFVRPALLNGESTDSEFDALFLIHAKGEIHFHESEPLLAPVTLIQFFWIHDLQPNNGGADRMTVMYGFLPEGSQIE